MSMLFIQAELHKHTYFRCRLACSLSLIVFSTVFGSSANSKSHDSQHAAATQSQNESGEFWGGGVQLEQPTTKKIVYLLFWNGKKLTHSTLRETSSQYVKVINKFIPKSKMKIWIQITQTYRTYYRSSEQALCVLLFSFIYIFTRYSAKRARGRIAHLYI